MAYNPQQERVPAGQPGGGQWKGHNVSRKAFTAMPAHERSRFLRSGGRVEDFHVSDLFERISQPDGGFTYQPLTHAQPKEGFALSLHPERSFGIDVKQLRFTDLARYVKQNRDLLKQTSNHLGAWHDPATHRVYLDVSTIVRSHPEAVKLARAHDQIAYYDLKRGVSVTVNRAATSGGASHAQH